jgi:hypothetical protein
MRVVAAHLMLALAVAPPVWAQSLHSIVVDQTGLPLPGVVVQLLDDGVPVASLTTGPDGSFDIGATLPGRTVVASLDGFETARVARQDAARIVLAIARTAETTTVVAPALPSSSPTASTVGSNLTATTVARLPSSRLKARESLPLLPAMVRGADGLLRLGGARPYDTPLLLDGFNVTNPATGTSNINLPFESVEGVEVLRDPMAVVYGGLLGGLVQMVSKPGGDRLQFGVQGFVPRLRLTSPGLGRLEGIFPRVYVGGAAAGGRFRYFGAVEYDFERIAVPDVTTGSGPNLVEQSATFFGRVDVRPHDRYNVTVETVVSPSATDNVGLSTRREESASVDVSQHDRFVGVTNRVVLDNASLVSVSVAVLAHDTTMSPKGEGPARLSPFGWRHNWFAFVERRAIRYSVAASWDRTLSFGRHEHALGITANMASQQLRGSVAENLLQVEDERGRLVRRIEFGAPSTLTASDAPVALTARDVWTFGNRLQLDVGARADRDSSYGAALARSARAGLRYAFEDDSATVVRAGYGGFVGRLPLAVEAFGGYPARVDTAVDAETGSVLDRTVLVPTVERLQLPRARAFTLQIERRLGRVLEGQIGFTNRQSTLLATLEVPTVSGPAAVRSTGTGSYKELQISIRRAWLHDQQLFLSYVRSSALGELNDFAALFQPLDAPLLQPGGFSRLPADARHRVIAWGTFNLPRRFVLSPVIEWHSGFPFSIVDERYRYFGTPNRAAYPPFFSADFILFKTVTVRQRSADLGIQLFNATNHFNPRDVYPVTGTPRFGTFTNSVGPVLRGFMMLKW